MYVNFYTSGGDWVGYVQIRFSYTPQYYIHPCTTWTNFPVSLPTEVEKVWRITLNRNSGIRLLIHCNNVEVLNILMTSNTCSYHSSWSTYWSRTVGKIWFYPNSDTASDYYRAGQSGRTVYAQHRYITWSLFNNGKLNNRSTTKLLGVLYVKIPLHR